MLKKKILIIIFMCLTIIGSSACGNDTLDKSQTISNVELSDNEVASSFESINTKDDQKTQSQVESPIDEQNIDLSSIDTIDCGNFMVVEDTAYEYYHYSESSTNEFANIIKNAAQNLKGEENIYTILVPTSIDITLPKVIRDTCTDIDDQRQAIDTIYNIIGDAAHNINIVDTLKAHNDEYIYFRTDHHWTALGAYYAYCDFAKAKGLNATSIDEFETKEFEGFLGSLYSESGELPQLLANPDTVKAYVPKSTNDMTFTDEAGNVTEWNIIEDVTDWNNGATYSTFVSGDSPYAVIENPQKKDGSACLLIKESYGNAIAPFLVDHYQHVYIIDYRYNDGTLTSFLDGTKVDDIIFVNYLSAAMSGTNIEKLEDFLE